MDNNRPKQQSYFGQGLLLMTLALSVLVGCDSPLEELNEKVAAEAEARRGVYVNLSAELQTAIATPDSQTEVELRRTVIEDGSELPLETLTIDGGMASFKPPETDPNGKYRYDIQIWYQSAASGVSIRLLLAEASKTKSYKRRVEFAAAELYTAPYDLDSSGSVEQSEIKYLDDDEDNMSNLAEIVAGGNPQNSAPTFVSPASITLAENDDNSGYLFYTARAISPRLTKPEDGTRQAITYAVITAMSKTGVDIKNLLTIDTGIGTLSTVAGKSLPAYDLLLADNNEYIIMLSAADSNETGELRLSLNITDIFNLSVTPSTKALQFKWAEVLDTSGTPATYYQLLQDINGDGDYILVTQNDPLGKITEKLFMLDVALHLIAIKPATRYQLKAYRQPDLNISAILIKTSSPLSLGNALTFPEDVISMIAYIKASNTGAGDSFGRSVALSADGKTLAVGAIYEDDAGQGVSCDRTDTTTTQQTCKGESGAVYVFQKNSASPVNGWMQQAQLKASNTGAGDYFGGSVALSADGQTLAVGASFEDDAGQGVNCDRTDTTTTQQTCKAASGGVYVFQKTNVSQNNGWIQQAQLKASNTGAGDQFGYSIALSADGQTLAVGAIYEDDAGQGVSCDSDVSSPQSSPTCKDSSGAAYVFQKNSASSINGWMQQAQLKASNAGARDRFGWSVALSADGLTLVVGAVDEDDAGQGVSCDNVLPNPPTSPTCKDSSGAVYVFQKIRDSSINGWVQEAQLKASNTGAGDYFGRSVALSADGLTLAVGAIDEDDAGLGVSCDSVNPNPPTSPTCKSNSGAVYVFQNNSASPINGWMQQAQIKASNSGTRDFFGTSVALSADGKTLAVGTPREDGVQLGVSHQSEQDPITAPLGDTANAALSAGAVYLYRQLGTIWQSHAYIKASNTEKSDGFGRSVALNADGQILAVGAIGEDGGGPANTNNCAAVAGTPLPSQETNCQPGGAAYIY